MLQWHQKRQKQKKFLLVPKFMRNCKRQIETVVFSKNTLSLGTADTSQVSNSCNRNTEDVPIRMSETAHSPKTYSSNSTKMIKDAPSEISGLFTHKNILSDRKQVEHTHLHCFHWKIHFTYSKINLILSVNAPYYNARRCSETVFKWSSFHFQNKVGEKE